MGCPGVAHFGLFHWFEGIGGCYHCTKFDGVDDTDCILALGFWIEWMLFTMYVPRQSKITMNYSCITHYAY